MSDYRENWSVPSGTMEAWTGSTRPTTRTGAIAPCAAGRPVRRSLLHRRGDHRHLLPAELPRRHPAAPNVRFYPTAAAAQRAGFRACKRCRPDATPGSPRVGRRGPTSSAGRCVSSPTAWSTARASKGWPPGSGTRPSSRAGAVGPGRRRAPRAGPGPAGADRPAADRDDRRCRSPRWRSRPASQHPPVQRHHPARLRYDAVRTSRPLSGTEAGGSRRDRCRGDDGTARGAAAVRRGTRCCGSSAPRRVAASRASPARYHRTLRCRTARVWSPLDRARIASRRRPAGRSARPRHRGRAVSAAAGSGRRPGGDRRRAHRVIRPGAVGRAAARAAGTGSRSTGSR